MASYITTQLNPLILLYTELSEARGIAKHLRASAVAAKSAAIELRSDGLASKFELVSSCTNSGVEGLAQGNQADRARDVNLGSGPREHGSEQLDGAARGLDEGVENLRACIQELIASQKGSSQGA